MQIRQLLFGIENLDIVLPEFQREYVWSLEHSKQYNNRNLRSKKSPQCLE